MKDDDEIRHELEALLELGLDRPGPPSPRQMLLARMIDPSAWSANATEHIEWCRRAHQLQSHSHFGATFARRRTISLIRAADMVRRMLRQDRGMADLETMDANALSSRLGAVIRRMNLDNRQRHVRDHAVRTVFSMRVADVVPEPVSEVRNDGSVVLSWTQDGRSAVITVGMEGDASITMTPSRAGVMDLNFGTWQSSTSARLLVVATDWVHYDGPDPAAFIEAEESDSVGEVRNGRRVA